MAKAPKSLSRAAGTALFVLAALILGYFGFRIVCALNGEPFPAVEKALLMLGAGVTLLVGARLIAATLKKSSGRLLMKIALWALFLLYIVLMLYFTLCASEFARTFKVAFTMPIEEMSRYMSEHVNFIPFKTIATITEAFNNGLVSAWSYAVNLIGNFVIFMPFAFFLPQLFRDLRRFSRTTITALLIVSVIEVLQVAFMTGILDVDDLIFNTAGAMLLYGITAIPPLKKQIYKFTMQ